MRIIAGTAKGRKLKTIQGQETRPTADRVKEAIFNLLGASVIDARVLDLYSGSGALGIEALSRGAKDCVFIDNNTDCIKVVKDNLENAGFTGQVLKQEADKALQDLAAKGVKFSLVFADPPYNLDLAKNLLSQIASHDILCASALILIEHSNREEVEENQLFTKLVAKRYGDTLVSLYRRR